MDLYLCPVRNDTLGPLVISKAGDVLTLNGQAFDFSPLADGNMLPAEAIGSEWFAGPVHRNGTDLVLTLWLPLPENYSQAQAFPTPLLSVADGDVDLPKPLPNAQPEELPA